MHIYFNYIEKFSTISVANKIVAAAEIWSLDQFNCQKIQIMKVWFWCDWLKTLCWIETFFVILASIDTTQTVHHVIDGLGQNCNNTIAKTLELLQYCAEPLICVHMVHCGWYQWFGSTENL